MGWAGIGGGAHVIFQHARALMDRGHEVSISVLEGPPDRTKPWHGAIGALDFIEPAEAETRSYDMCVATWWRTAFTAPRISARNYAYFVQMIEQRFYAHMDENLRKAIAATYDLPMPLIVVAQWMSNYFVTRHGRSASVVLNGIDKSLFRPEGPTVAPRQPGRLRILVEGPIGVTHKNVERTIGLLRQSTADEIWLLTGSPIKFYPGIDRLFSGVKHEKCPEIYRSCDAIVKLSLAESVGLPPLEMFHCGGTAIAYGTEAFSEYMLNSKDSLVVPVCDEAAVIAAVNRLKEEPQLLERLRAGAVETASRWPTVEAASETFARTVEAIAAGPPQSRDAIEAGCQLALKANGIDNLDINPYERDTGGSALSRLFAHSRRAIRGSALYRDMVLPWQCRLVRERRSPPMPVYD